MIFEFILSDYFEVICTKTFSWSLNSLMSFACWLFFYFF